MDKCGIACRPRIISKLGLRSTNLHLVQSLRRGIRSFVLLYSFMFSSFCGEPEGALVLALLSLQPFIPDPHFSSPILHCTWSPSFACSCAVTWPCHLVSHCSLPVFRGATFSAGVHAGQPLPSCACPRRVASVGTLVTPAQPHRHGVSSSSQCLSRPAPAT